MKKIPLIPHPHIHNQTGVGLVEVLVALIILSVGLLGIASLYVTTLQAKTTSLSRMKATYLAQDMADRMRANPSAVNDTATGYELASGQGLSQSGEPSCTSPCTPAQIASIDKYQWTKMISDTGSTSNGTGLPGTVSRSIDITNATLTSPAIATIYLKWSEPNGGELDYTLLVQI